jgi:ABC-type multidrug transport system fused ATPase/permease subunit
MDIHHINMVLFNIITAFSAFITFAASFSVLAGYNILYGILMLAAGIPAGISAVIYTKKLYILTLSQIAGERQKGYVNSLATDRHYAPSVRLFNIGDILKKRYAAVWETMFLERRKSIKLRSFVSCLLSFLPEMVILYVGIDVSVKVLGKQAPIGDYSLYTGLVTQLWMGIYMLVNSAVQIYDNQLRVSNFKSLDAFKNRIENNGRRKLGKVESIEYANVTFTYPGNVSPSLKNVSFQIAKAEKIVFVGLNGSGKSTLIKLLLRFYDVDDGHIKINGVDIKEYDVDDIRRSFSVYFQDDFNYCFTLRDNIAIADHDHASDERIIGALRESGAEDILGKASEGLDTYLSRLFSETGIELSIGQGQKVALARAFFRRHTALILDEPSSSLDPKSEHELFERLKLFTDGKITIFSSHRLSNVSLADKIIVLDNGEVLEIGTQSELLENKGRYAELFGYQRDKFM